MAIVGYEKEGNIIRLVREPKDYPEMVARLIEDLGEETELVTIAFNRKEKLIGTLTNYKEEYELKSIALLEIGKFNILRKGVMDFDY